MGQIHGWWSTPRRVALSVLIAPLAAGLAACSGGGNPLAAPPYDATGQIAFSAADGGRQVDPDKPLTVTAKGGSTITDVTATDAAGRFVGGELSPDDKTWHSTSPLAAGAHYTVRVSTRNGDGAEGRQSIGFDTKPADGSLRVSFGPNSGTYGVGEPVTAELSRPVKDAAARRTVESGLHVTTIPAVAGAWHWVDDRTLHYRPRDYWPAGTLIQVRSSLAGTRIKDNLYGGSAKPLTLHIGDRVVAVTDAATHRLTVRRNGRLERTIPVTTGKPGFDTRNGVKVVLGKQSVVRMKSSTIGIGAGSRDSYDLMVHWAVRVTWSGEYVHAAPWSVGAQGSANVSHGCTGMNTASAQWFFHEVRRGDIVEVVNSQGSGMEPFGNGFGDWNLSWKQWIKGSALGGSGSSGDRPGPAGPADGRGRLIPQT